MAEGSLDMPKRDKIPVRYSTMLNSEKYRIGLLIVEDLNVYFVSFFKTSCTLQYKESPHCELSFHDGALFL